MLGLPPGIIGQAARANWMKSGHFVAQNEPLMGALHAGMAGATTANCGGVRH